MCDDNARLRETYVAAVRSLPPLVRAVFLLHRIDDLSYRRIAARLSIDDELAMRCVGRALYQPAAEVGFLAQRLAWSFGDGDQQHAGFCCDLADEGEDQRIFGLSDEQKRL